MHQSIIPSFVISFYAVSELSVDSKRVNIVMKLKVLKLAFVSITAMTVTEFHAHPRFKLIERAYRVRTSIGYVVLLLLLFLEYV